MAKAKSQVELAELFAQGATDGTSGFLQVHGNTIFNTEEPHYSSDQKYHPIAVRLTEKVALMNDRNKGSQFNDQFKKVRQALDNAGYLGLEHDCSFAGMSMITDPLQPDQGYLVRIVKSLGERVEAAKAGGFPDPDGERQQRALHEFMTSKTRNDEKAKLDTLISLPEILEQAIKDKKVDVITIQQAIKARDEVKTLIQKVDNYLALLMALPSETGAGEIQTHEGEPSL